MNTAGKKWQLPAIPPEPGRPGRPADLPPGLAAALPARGIDCEEQLRFFLRPPHRLPYDPARLAGMEPALQRLHRAIVHPERREAETVGIVGDFDVDGVTGTAILMEGLTDFGLTAIPYLPHRVAEGHGLSFEAVNRLEEQGVSLLITVDCGISSIAETALAQERGIDVLITDHHTPAADWPGAAAIINPRMPGNEYPFPHLCGAGLAWKLMQGLYHRYGRAMPPALLELAALGTIADLVPLRDENRYLVQAGLRELNRTRRPGLRALYRQAGLRAGGITAGNAAFQIVPRLNSPGRMGHALDSLRLLTTSDAAAADSLAARLEGQNRERRDLTRRVCASAWESVACQPTSPPLILINEPETTPGIAGLVAARMVEAFHRPAVALAPLDNGNFIASGRSIPSFNLIQALNACGDLLLRHGGHSQAAGFTINPGQLPRLESRLTAIAGELLEADDWQPTLRIDAEIGLDELTPDFLRWLKNLEPFGPGNPLPIFLSRNLNVAEARRVGQDEQHLRLLLRQGRNRYTALAFNRASQWDDRQAAIDLVYSVNMEQWQGAARLTLLAQDFRPAGAAETPRPETAPCPTA